MWCFNYEGERLVIKIDYADVLLGFGRWLGPKDHGVNHVERKQCEKEDEHAPHYWYKFEIEEIPQALSNWKERISSRTARNKEYNENLKRKQVTLNQDLQTCIDGLDLSDIKMEKIKK